MIGDAVKELDKSTRSPFLPAPARIAEMHRENAGTFTFILEPPDGAAGFTFYPGQFNMLYLFGAGEVAISMSGDPADTQHIVHTIREVGAVTRALGALRVGEVVGLRGPYGTPWPVAQARGRDILLVAGGLGVAPLRPALLHILAQRQEYGRVALLYGARSPEELIFCRELASFSQRADLQTLLTVDHADTAWHGQVGVVTALLSRASFDPARVTALVCGPEVMMRFTVRELARLGVRDEDIFLSLERNMKCAVGLCGHCQFGPSFVCRQGPVLRYDAIRSLLSLREV